MIVCGLLHQLRQYVFFLFQPAGTASCLHHKGDWIMFSGAISVTLKKEAAHFSENFEKIIFFISYLLS